ncbi:poly(A) polymerase [Aerosakkonema funiforme]|uniref:poly(A) polymerase n=1 Tax=Aerosakkonema funiforme TaxID=1246630 RepID=UPI0035B78940
MATSREVYHRIVWDARLNANAFTIGYRDRRWEERIWEKPLVEWQADGDIPWHRIRYFRCQDTIVWDRDRHLDLLSTDELPPAAWVTPAQAQINPVTSEINNSATSKSTISTFKARPVYEYISLSWQAVDRTTSTKSNTLKIVSLNVLCDTYESEIIQTAKRIPVIAAHLRSGDADIIALQEVTLPLLEFLLTQDWVRDYFISESPSGSTLPSHGILILSKLPFTLVEHEYSQHKRVLVGTWLVNDEQLQVAAVHLTSDRARNAIEKRTHQISILLEYLKTQPGDCLIVGDFNTKNDELAGILTENNYIDVWQELHPEAAGYTFDPQQNPLAALMSLTGEVARLDRILLRDEDKRWIPQSIELFANEAIPDTEATLYPSDHFGIKAVLRSSIDLLLQTIPPVYQSAVVVIPPAEIWSPIQTIRRRFDRRFDRWMPHINLLYGFLPAEYFESAANAIAQALKEIKPFAITLENFATFTHRSSCTAWLRPVAEPPSALDELQSILQQIFPQCNEQSTKSSAGFTPHLSVGQFRTAQAAISQLPEWYPLTFPVESIALISREGDEPFQVRYLVELETGKVESVSNKVVSNLMQIANQLSPELSPEQQAHRESILSVLQQACQECLGFPTSLHLLGSARLGVQTLHSDIDAMCLIPADLSAQAFLQSVQQKLQDLCEKSILVEDAIMPVLRMQIEGVGLDLLVARTTHDIAKLKQLQAALPSKFDPVSWKAVLGCLEADAIVQTVTQRLPFESFQKLLRAVRGWAKARQIHGNAWGFLGNFTWTLLAAWSCQNYPQDMTSPETENLLVHFFQKLSQHDWSQPISLSEAGRNYRVLSKDWLPIITAIEPCQNSARNVCRSTAKILQSEFDRAAKLAAQALADRISWSNIFEIIDLHTQTPQFLVLTATTANETDREIYSGWLLGHIIGLVIDLERQLNISVRPWPEIIIKNHTSSAILGLEISATSQLVEIEQIAKKFIDRFNYDRISNPHNKWEIVVCDRETLTQQLN